MLKTLIVEDTRATLDYLNMQLGKVPELDIIAAVSTYDQGTEALKGDVDLLVTDLGLPDGSGIDLIRTIKSKPDTKAIVVSVFGDEKNVVGAIEAGADGYLLKDATLSEIDAAVKNALTGIAPISPAIAGHLLKKIRTVSPATNAAPSIHLTQTETIVLETLAKGFSYKEIARLQNVSFHTVNEHLKTIYKKLSVNSRGEAVYEATRTGLINP